MAKQPMMMKPQDMMMPGMQPPAQMPMKSKSPIAGVLAKRKAMKKKQMAK